MFDLRSIQSRCQDNLSHEKVDRQAASRRAKEGGQKRETKKEDKEGGQRGRVTSEVVAVVRDGATLKARLMGVYSFQTKGAELDLVQLHSAPKVSGKGMSPTGTDPL